MAEKAKDLERLEELRVYYDEGDFPELIERGEEVPDSSPWYFRALPNPAKLLEWLRTSRARDDVLLEAAEIAGNVVATLGSDVLDTLESGREVVERFPSPYKVARLQPQGDFGEKINRAFQALEGTRASVSKILETLSPLEDLCWVSSAPYDGLEELVKSMVGDLLGDVLNGLSVLAGDTEGYPWRLAEDVSRGCRSLKMIADGFSGLCLYLMSEATSWEAAYLLSALEEVEGATVDLFIPSVLRDPRVRYLWDKTRLNPAVDPIDVLSHEELKWLIRARKEAGLDFSLCYRIALRRVLSEADKWAAQVMDSVKDEDITRSGNLRLAMDLSVVIANLEPDLALALTLDEVDELWKNALAKTPLREVPCVKSIFGLKG